MPNIYYYLLTPRYRELYQRYKDIKTDITLIEKTTLITKIKNMSESDHEMLYLLIACYNSSLSDKTTVDSQSNTCIVNIRNIPYSGQKIKSGIKFFMDDIPSALQHILRDYFE